MGIVWPHIIHWSLIPITISGALIAVDATKVLQGRNQLFRPSVLVSFFGLHFFYFAPLLHLGWDYWPKMVIPPEDWREMLGWLSVIHVLGLCIYRATAATPQKWIAHRTLRVERLTLALGVLSLVSLIAFVGLVASQGGIGSYIALVTGEREQLGGFGWIFLLSEPWPLLGLIYLLIRFPVIRRNAFALVLIVVVFAALQFMVGGLRGSRSNVIWPTIMALAFVHLFAIRIARRAILVGVVALVPFMYLYGIYKGGGVEAVQAMQSGVSAEVLAGETGRGYDLVLLEDFGRAGTQIVVLDGVLQERGAGLAWGVGYLGDIAKLAPDFLVPFDIPDKVDLGTATLYGAEALEGEWRSSRIYGLTGEALMNFGLVGGVLIYGFLGRVVGRLDAIYDRTIAAQGLTLGHLIMPVAAVACILLVGSDIDNVLWFVAKQGGLLLLAVLFALGPKVDRPAVA